MIFWIDHKFSNLIFNGPSKTAPSGVWLAHTLTNSATNSIFWWFCLNTLKNTTPTQKNECFFKSMLKLRRKECLHLGLWPKIPLKPPIKKRALSILSWTYICRLVNGSHPCCHNPMGTMIRHIIFIKEMVTDIITNQRLKAENINFTSKSTVY